MTNTHGAPARCPRHGLDTTIDCLQHLYRYAVDYTDSHGEPTRDTFATAAEAQTRHAYLIRRGRPAVVVVLR